MRVVGVLLIGIAVLIGGIAALWTLWRAVGAEVDYCPEGDCIAAYWITVPAMLVALILGWTGTRLVRRSGRH